MPTATKRPEADLNSKITEKPDKKDKKSDNSDDDDDINNLL